MKVKMGKKKDQKLKKRVSSTKKSKSPDPKAKSLDHFLETWDDEDSRENGNENSESPSDDEGEEAADEADNKKYLNSLQKKDPEFYKFLKDNDEKLLNFEESDDDEDSEGEAEGAHEAPDNLEVASDESEFEEEEDDNQDEEEKKVAKGGRVKITAKILKEWEDKLESKPSVALIDDAAEALKAAIDGLGSGEIGGKAKKVRSFERPLQHY